MKKTLLFGLMVAMALCPMISACGKIAPSSDDPIKTGKATQISQYSAVLWGAVNKSALRQGAEIGIVVYESEDSSLHIVRKLVEIVSDKNNSFFVNVYDLKSNTKYFYKAFLNVAGTYCEGEMKSFTTMQYIFPAGAVDLGLPSGLKWASCNLGASAPEEYGDYYAWGETTPKSDYSWSTYKFEIGAGNHGPFSKYVTDPLYGTVDNNTILDPEDDAAHIILGGSWRMPTDLEWDELKSGCKWRWTAKNGYDGHIVTGPNGNSIFLPAAGYRDDTYLSYAGYYGLYWSSSVRTVISGMAWRVMFDTGSVSGYGSYSDRYFGFSVRPVTE